MKKLISILKKLTESEYIFSIISKIIGLILGVMLSVLTSRYFGVELKGVLSVIGNDVTLMATFIGLGIYQAYPFYKKKEPEIFQIYVNNITSYFIISEIILLILGAVLWYYGIDNLFIFALLLVPMEVYTKQLNYVLLIENPQKRNATYMYISFFEILVILVIWLVLDAGIVSVLIYYSSSTVLKLMLSFMYNSIRLKNFQFNIKRLLEFIKFGFVPMLVFICMTINYKIDIQMLKWFEQNGNIVTYSDIGIYAVAITLATKVWLIPDAIKDILLSKLIKMKNSGEKEVAKIIRINLFICIASIILLIVFGKPMITLLYGKDFEQVYYVMIFLFVGILGMIFYKMIYSYNIANGKRTINLIFLGISAIINFIGNLFLIPVLGLWGAVIMSVISYSVCGVCFLVYFKIKSRIPLGDILFIKKSDLLLFKNKIQ